MQNYIYSINEGVFVSFVDLDVNWSGRIRGICMDYICIGYILLTYMSILVELRKLVWVRLVMGAIS